MPRNIWTFELKDDGRISGCPHGLGFPTWKMPLVGDFLSDCITQKSYRDYNDRVAALISQQLMEEHRLKAIRKGREEPAQDVSPAVAINYMEKESKKLNQEEEEGKTELDFVVDAKERKWERGRQKSRMQSRRLRTTSNVSTRSTSKSSKVIIATFPGFNAFKITRSFRAKRANGSYNPRIHPRVLDPLHASLSSIRKGSGTSDLQAKRAFEESHGSKGLILTRFPSSRGKFVLCHSFAEKSDGSKSKETKLQDDTMMNTMECVKDYESRELAFTH
mmetsp:Transcript_6024/g.8353  ORF Transcript_6024/g.8353 Transcript_6024/m.8353 type:complete len:276 (+) Transcript_6024:195-1022(+)|eukprot:CAMPEP_0184483756 /NCGR_PEP_ID=MMETSP0113_2-20130426/5432_1 /TAXON_ID=91329 /ORGANISM="Norrisiella sphaerica, Strain BC52" /LENGTH=275 /DNA_ID=CAMNT_0026864349 /DNA_START=195 /DNA_END=1022 /DNA_ORIENTATION=+